MKNTTTKNITTILTMALLFGVFALTAKANTGDDGKILPPAKTMTESQWDAYGDHLVAALASDHEGLKQGALRMIIQHGENLDVQAGVFDVVRIYRNHENQNMRRMAIVALGEMQSPWANDFLTRSLRFEEQPELRQTIKAVLSQQN